MKTNKLILAAFVLMSNITFSQTQKAGFWSQDVAGLKLIEVVIAVVAFIGLFIISYFVSTANKKH